MKRFSIKWLPSKYAKCGYTLSQMTTNHLRLWKHQGYLDDETGFLFIERSNSMENLFIGSSQPDNIEDIIVTGVDLAIYFDGKNLMVKAKGDLSLDYIVENIDEVVATQLETIAERSNAKPMLELSEEDKRSILITNLMGDSLNYLNGDRQCDCTLCELSTLCRYKNKHQRLGREHNGLGACYKLEEHQLLLYDFIDSHLEEYERILEDRHNQL